MQYKWVQHVAIVNLEVAGLAPVLGRSGLVLAYGLLAPGLSDIFGTWYPNRKKSTKWTQNVPNDHKTSQMSIPNGHKIYQHFSIQGPPKFTQIGIFGLKNKPSGNPASHLFRLTNSSARSCPPTSTRTCPRPSWRTRTFRRRRACSPPCPDDHPPGADFMKMFSDEIWNSTIENKIES
jgi:hypothetical protein